LSAQPVGDTSPDVEVTWQDQNTLNTFARTNNKVKVLEAELKDKKELLEQLKDAEGDVMMLTEGPIRVQIGETYFHLDESDTLSHIEKVCYCSCYYSQPMMGLASPEAQSRALFLALSLSGAFFMVLIVTHSVTHHQNTEKLSEEVDALEAAIEEHKSKIQELKAHLYAKFGRQINLDD
jgi:chaperonin cofactor prefoldin